MSFDLEIVANQIVDAKHLESFFSQRREFAIRGALNSGSTNVLVTRRKGSIDQPSFTIDGPFRVELDDLNDNILTAVLDPRWLVQLSVPAAATAVDIKAALELARFIADACFGAVYDPQQDRVVWPKRGRRRYVAPTGEERIRLLGLDWFLPASQRSSDTASTLLKVLRRSPPEALPRRFGTFEPLQNRLQPGGDQPFIWIWKETSEVEFGGSFFWQAKSPFYGGSVFFPDWRDKYKPARVERAIHLSLDIDGRAVDSDPRWCEAVVSMFVAIAQGLRAFYAMGYVRRNVIARRSIFFDGSSEGSPNLPGRWWLGLPPRPVWLAWFGAEYAKDVKPSLTRYAPTVTTKGILLRLGRAAMDRDQLTNIFPVLPENLIAIEEGEDFKAAFKIPHFA